MLDFEILKKNIQQAVGYIDVEFKSSRLEISHYEALGLIAITSDTVE